MHSSAMYTANVPMDGWRALLLGTMDYIPPYILVLRSILSLRHFMPAISEADVESRSTTAFGPISTSGHGSAASAIIFAEGRQNER